MNTCLPGLEFAGVSHAYATETVVQELNLVVPVGSLTCLLGPSGCGKTTVLRLAAGLETLQIGWIKINGTRVADDTDTSPPEVRDVGLMFQEYALFPHLTVLGNVSFGLDALPAESRETTAKAALAQVGMVGAANAYPHMLSGGEQQRVALARVVAPRPKIMLLDEPFSGLDTELRASLREDTLRLIKETGATTLMVTHDPMEAMLMADHVALMHNGRVIQAGSPMDLYRQPESSFCARFLGEVIDYVGFVRSGEVVTPLGSVPAGGAEDGEEVQILIRPEALHLDQETEVGGVKAKVSDQRDLGPHTKLALQLEESGEQFHVNLSGRDLPSAGSKVAVHLDFSMVFVFPVRDR